MSKIIDAHNLHIQIYTAYMTDSHAYVKGRLLKDKPIISNADHGIFKSLVHMVTRALTREMKHHAVSYSIIDVEKSVLTDHEGYFEIYENIEHLNHLEEVSIPVTVVYKDQANTKAVQLEHFHNDVAEGIISDIDDTILVTGVKSFFKIKVILNTLFLNPFRRKPLDNAAEFFHDILNKSQCAGPMIYLSNSPWNLYNYLSSFLEYNKFPKGLIILRDMGVQLLKSKSIDQMNKYIEIEKALTSFSNTNFTLIGDSGEHDFNIYRTIEKKYPERIIKVIIKKAGNKKVEDAIKSYIKENPKFVYVENYSIEKVNAAS